MSNSEKILIVAATKNEVYQTINFLSDNKLYNKIEILITGIGIPNTLYKLTKKLSSTKYKLILNIGIAGSSSRGINIGDIVHVKKDSFSDLGTDDNGDFISIFDLGFTKNNSYPFTNGYLFPEELNYKKIEKLNSVTGSTVNMTSGSTQRISQIYSKSDAEIETMEGAAVFFVAMNERIPVIQIRSISNYVEPRNKANWNISKAISNLNNYLISNILPDLLSNNEQ